MVITYAWRIPVCLATELPQFMDQIEAELEPVLKRKYRCRHRLEQPPSCCPLPRAIPCTTPTPHRKLGQPQRAILVPFDHDPLSRAVTSLTRPTRYPRAAPHSPPLVSPSPPPLSLPCGSLPPFGAGSASRGWPGGRVAAQRAARPPQVLAGHPLQRPERGRHVLGVPSPSRHRGPGAGRGCQAARFRGALVRNDPFQLARGWCLYETMARTLAAARALGLARPEGLARAVSRATAGAAACSCRTVRPNVHCTTASPRRTAAAVSAATAATPPLPQLELHPGGGLRHRSRGGGPGRGRDSAASGAARGRRSSAATTLPAPLPSPVPPTARRRRRRARRPRPARTRAARATRRALRRRSGRHWRLDIPTVTPSPSPASAAQITPAAPPDLPGPRSPAGARSAGGEGEGVRME